MTDKFCVAPWHSIAFDPAGKEEICCDIRGQNINRFDIQRDFSLGVFPSACSICYHNEKNNLSSSRIRFNKRLKDTNFFYAVGDCDIREVHLDLGNLCNNRCLTCSPEFSTQIYKKWKDLGWLQSPPSYIKAVTDKQHLDSYRDEGFFENYRSLITATENLTRLRFVGGEPLLNPRLDQYIDAIPKDIAEKTTVLICTNGSIYDERLVSKLGKFSNVEFTISIDAYGELNDRIRLGSSWSTVESNFLKYKQHINDKFAVIVNCTVSVYNILDLDKLVHWVLEHGVNLNLNIVHDPSFLSPLNIPGDWKLLATRRLVQLEKTITDIKTKLSLRGLLSSIDNHRFDEDLWNDFRSYNKHLKEH